MNSKITALPLILALAAGGCSNTPQYYPNFKACYNDTGDANDCLQYIDENGRELTASNTSGAYSEGTSSTTGTSQDSNFDGSSALAGAAVGAAAGYALSNNNSKKRKEDTPYIVPPSNGNDTSRTKSSPSALSKTTPAKSNSSKSITVRSGFGSTGSKSFGS